MKKRTHLECGVEFMHSSALSVVALQPPGSPVQPDGEEVPPAALPALLQAAAVAHLTALPSPTAHLYWWLLQH